MTCQFTLCCHFVYNIDCSVYMSMLIFSNGRLVVVVVTAVIVVERRIDGGCCRCRCCWS